MKKNRDNRRRSALVRRKSELVVHQNRVNPYKAKNRPDVIDDYDVYEVIRYEKIKIASSDIANLEAKLSHFVK